LLEGYADDGAHEFPKTRPVALRRTDGRVRKHLDQLRCLNKSGKACWLVTNVGKFAKKVGLVFGNGHEVDRPFWS
jgi:hypothetical protein